MKQNSFFSINRFGRFLSAYMQLNYKRYLYIIAGAFIAFYAWFLFFMNNTLHHFDVQYSFYMSCLSMGALALGAFVGSAFPEWSDKIKTGNYLLLPASTFEKALSQFLIYIVGGILFFCVIFYVDAHLARWTLMHTERYISGEHTIDALNGVMLSKIYQSDEPWSLILWIIFSIACLLFSIRLFFSRFGLVKTVIAVGAILFLFFFCLTFSSFLFYADENTVFRLLDLKTPVHNVHKGWDNVAILFFVFFGATTFLSLCLAYFKLKEKQV
ncbi:MAG: hypothetical protein LBS25_07190 [Candidatus Symbiothrix sp.]|jgi:hypothetical protein|nr:hypothetical protein [Candidatus Symbiothrix sp.]